MKAKEQSLTNETMRKKYANRSNGDRDTKGIKKRQKMSRNKHPEGIVFPEGLNLEVSHSRTIRQDTYSSSVLFAVKRWVSTTIVYTHPYPGQVVSLLVTFFLSSLPILPHILPFLL